MNHYKVSISPVEVKRWNVAREFFKSVGEYFLVPISSIVVIAFAWVQLDQSTEAALNTAEALAEAARAQHAADVAYANSQTLLGALNQQIMRADIERIDLAVGLAEFACVNLPGKSCDGYSNKLLQQLLHVAKELNKADKNPEITIPDKQRWRMCRRIEVIQASNVGFEDAISGMISKAFQDFCKN